MRPESDYDMSVTDRTILRLAEAKECSAEFPHPNSPTPYEDDKHAVVGKMLQEGIDEEGAQQLKRLIQEENHYSDCIQNIRIRR